MPELTFEDVENYKTETMEAEIENLEKAVDELMEAGLVNEKKLELTTYVLNLGSLAPVDRLKVFLMSQKDLTVEQIEGVIRWFKCR